MTAMIDTLDTAKKIVEATIAVSLASNAWMGAAVASVWGLVNSLQLIGYYPMLQKMRFPANMLIFHNVMLGLSSLDIFPTDLPNELFFDFSEDEDEPYCDTLEDMGYETHNSILNLGSCFYFGAIIWFQAIFVLLQYVLYRLWRKTPKYYKDVTPRYVGECYIILAYNTSMEYLIAAILNNSKAFDYT